MALGPIVITLGVVAHPLYAARTLALARSDYPVHASIAVVPATNAQADHFFGPAQRSTFERLHRLDGTGWLQFATWRFKTGRGPTLDSHQTLFGYAVNVFPSHAAAKRALRDIKLTTHPGHVAHLPALRSLSSDARSTLRFAIFLYRAVEIEAYYEYQGAAPAKIARLLRHAFNRQLSHLARLVRVYLQSPSPTLVPPTATPTLTPTASPTATVTPTTPATPTATLIPSSTPTATATPTPSGLVVTARPSSPQYSPGQTAVIDVSVTLNGQPAENVAVQVTIAFAGRFVRCDATTGTNGGATCSATVPTEPNGTVVPVEVQATDPKGNIVFTQTSFVIQGH